MAQATKGKLNYRCPSCFMRDIDIDMFYDEGRKEYYCLRCNFTGSEAVYERHIRKLCRHAKDAGIPLEINLLGLRTNRHYPRPYFWQIAGEEGCQVILGCDAHEPEAFLEKTGLHAAMELVKQFHLDLIQTANLRQL